MHRGLHLGQDHRHPERGLNVGEHVMELYRDRLAAQEVLDSRELASVPDGTTVRVAGLQSLP